MFLTMVLYYYFFKLKKQGDDGESPKFKKVLMSHIVWYFNFSEPSILKFQWLMTNFSS
jgi:hypothetical protein